MDQEDFEEMADVGERPVVHMLQWGELAILTNFLPDNDSSVGTYRGHDIHKHVHIPSHLYGGTDPLPGVQPPSTPSDV